MRVPFRRLAGEFEKAANQSRPSFWRALGALIDRNLDELDRAAGDVREGWVSTTDATATTIVTIHIPAETTLLIDATVVGRRTGGSAGTAEDGAAYRRLNTWKNVAGTATAIGVGAAPLTNEDQAGWTVSFINSSNEVRVQVTGAANNEINWYASVRVFTVS